MRVIKKIVKESLMILVAASILSTIGGIGLEAIKQKVAFFIPLLILIPALNDMIGDFGTIISSRFTTLLFEGKIRGKWWKSKELAKEFGTISTISLFIAFYLGMLSIFFSILQGFKVNTIEILKVVAVSYILTASLVLAIFFVSIVSGLFVYKRKKDPNNILIPLTTALADIGSLILFSILVWLLF